MTSSYPMKKNTATKIVFPILDADGDPVTGAAGLDSEYNLDGGSFTDCVSEATEIGTTGIYYLNLAAGETNGDVFCIQVKTSTSGAKTTVLVFYTATQTLDETDVVCDAIHTHIDDLHDTDLPAVKAKTDLIVTGGATEANVTTVSGKVDTVDTVVDAVKLKTDNLPTDPADESLLEAEINANETKIDALQTDVTAIKGYVDTEVGAIKTQTDKLTFDGSNNVSATVADKTGFSLSAAGIDSIVDEVMEGTLTLRQAIKLFLSALAGKSGGGGTATLTFQDNADTKARITATVDANGNRTAITLDAT